MLDDQKQSDGVSEGPHEWTSAALPTTPARVIDILSVTTFPFRKWENSPSGTTHWNKAGKKASGPSRLPTKEEFEKLAALIAEARGKWISEIDIRKFLRWLGFETGQIYWSQTEVADNTQLAYWWEAWNTVKPDYLFDTPLRRVSKKTDHLAQYVQPIG